MNTRKLSRGLGLASVMIALGACAAPESDEGSRDDATASATQAFSSLDVVAEDDEGVPTFANGTFGQTAVANALTREDKETALRATLEQLRPIFHLDLGELSLKDAIKDNIGDEHFVYAQTRNGLEVLGGALVLHTRDGAVYAVHGEARGDLDAPFDATIAEEDAIAAAKQEASQDAIEAEASPRLAYRRAGNRLELVYVVKVTGARRDGLPVDDDVLVSAGDGRVVARMPHVHTARFRAVYSANNGTALPGTLRKLDGFPWSSTDPAVVGNFQWLGVTYDCYAQLFGRDSYDNAGAMLQSSVHYRSGYSNAFWNGTQMVYGDGDGETFGNLAMALDVTAHELTHAVTGSTSQLVYAGESGGLNESMSDIFAAVCEWFRDGQVVSDNTWKMGEDVYTPASPTDALRYMNDPRGDGQSLDHYADYASGIDVHYSSGISNLAFYLLAQGGAHPRGRSNVSVQGIGISRAAQIFYRANTVTLLGSPNATFADAKIATEQAAAQLGYSSSVIASVTAAWKAVGVGVSTPTCNHYRCDMGGALNAGCNWCVQSICDVDPFCCNSYWDAICVREVETVCNSLVCGASAGSCSHTVCLGGDPLANGCSSCAQSICAVDPYCCNVYWDSICVSEVNSVCGKNCG